MDVDFVRTNTPRRITLLCSGSTTTESPVEVTNEEDSSRPYVSISERQLRALLLGAEQKQKVHLHSHSLIQQEHHDFGKLHLGRKIAILRL